jgi:hypothetical protein
VARIAAGAPTLFPKLKPVAETAPDTLGVTLYVPASPFAVSTVDVATPLPLVTPVALEEPEKVALAPLPGAVKETEAPLTGVL